MEGIGRKLCHRQVYLLQIVTVSNFELRMALCVYFRDLLSIYDWKTLYKLFIFLADGSLGVKAEVNRLKFRH